MALYNEAASLLTKGITSPTSLKRAIYDSTSNTPGSSVKKDKPFKSPPAALYALVLESTKWSGVLSQVVQNARLLQTERKLTPTLALVLVHDLLLSKKGIAAPKNHELNLAVTRNKTRLVGEFTKCRIRNGFASVDAWRAHLDAEAVVSKTDQGTKETATRPRWVRINTLRTSLETVLQNTFKDFDVIKDLASLLPGQRNIYIDEHVPNLVAVSQTIDLSKSTAYLNGELIFQDKASCFPAYLLDPSKRDKHMIDACAAPGNKTTHLAALIAAQSRDGPTIKITACERSPLRAETLSKMVQKANAGDSVSILAKQDFLELDPTASEFADVTALLLDPSCSGSGIVGRDDEDEVDGQIQRTLTLPTGNQVTGAATSNKRGKKRKRAAKVSTSTSGASEEKSAAPAVQVEAPPTDPEALQRRLESLANFQVKMIRHAFRFPAATRVTYSTCSIHATENESVVVRALESPEGRNAGWRVLPLKEQVEGMRKWPVRGVKAYTLEAIEHAGSIGGTAALAASDAKEISAAMIRCEKGTELGTMGFFVVAFVREHKIS